MNRTRQEVALGGCRKEVGGSEEGPTCRGNQQYWENQRTSSEVAWTDHVCEGKGREPLALGTPKDQHHLENVAGQNPQELPLPALRKQGFTSILRADVGQKALETSSEYIPVNCMGN